jgi:hypothetical protein
MSSFAPAFAHQYQRGSRGESLSRARLADERDRLRGRGRYDTRTVAQRKADNRRNLLNVATLVVPLGGAYRAGRFLHYGIMKGARPLVFTSRGTQQVRFYDLGAKRFISKRAYQSREGITKAPSYARSLYRSGTRYVERKFPRTIGTLRRAEQVSSLAKRGPVGFVQQRLLNKVIPRPVQWGIGAVGTYVTVKEAVSNFRSEEESGSYRRFRTPRSFGKSNPPGRSNHRKVSWVYNEHRKKSQPRCPPGYRYDPRSNSCVRVR